MRTAKELYPELYNDEFYSTSDYQPIISEIGNVLIQIDDDDYQGDSRILYEKDGKYGYLIFGWGSCSGCDALQACSNIKHVQDLMDELVDSVQWFDSLEELKAYFKEKDWELEYSYYSDNTRKFVESVLNHN